MLMTQICILILSVGRQPTRMSTCMKALRPGRGCDGTCCLIRVTAEKGEKDAEGGSEKKGSDDPSWFWTRWTEKETEPSMVDALEWVEGQKGSVSMYNRMKMIFLGPTLCWLPI